LLRLLNNLSRSDLELVGTKAANLGELYSLGLNVPRGFVIPTYVSSHFFDICFGKNWYDPIYPLSARPKITYDINLDAMCALLQETPFPRNIEDCLVRYFLGLNLNLASVRSSTTIEDSARLSFAGIFDTFLNVDRNNLGDSVKRCWCSIFSKRAVDYFYKNNIKLQKLNIAVIVQEMIEPDISGICFTSNPITHNDNEVYIEAAWGLGEAVVSGRTTPDLYIYDLTNKHLKDKNISPQKTKLMSVHNKIVEVEVDINLRNRQKLSDDLIFQLVSQCSKMQAHYKSPQDIEFAVKDGIIYFLQSRPITTM
jgi:phosphoenolpyruvate synthase/pyruvate phosphate dikinase